MTATTATRPVSNTVELVTEEMLARFDERTMRHDRENSFFHDDFEDLRASGYFTASVPADLGGGGAGRVLPRHR